MPFGLSAQGGFLLPAALPTASTEARYLRPPSPRKTGPPAPGVPPGGSTLDSCGAATTRRPLEVSYVFFLRLYPRPWRLRSSQRVWEMLSIWKEKEEIIKSNRFENICNTFKFQSDFQLKLTKQRYRADFAGWRRKAGHKITYSFCNGIKCNWSQIIF